MLYHLLTHTYTHTRIYYIYDSRYTCTIMGIGELAALMDWEPSPVSVTADTVVETLCVTRSVLIPFIERGLAKGRTTQLLVNSMQANAPNTVRVREQHKDLTKWNAEKARIIAAERLKPPPGIPQGKVEGFLQPRTFR